MNRDSKLPKDLFMQVRDVYIREPEMNYEKALEQRLHQLECQFFGISDDRLLEEDLVAEQPPQYRVPAWQCPEQHMNVSFPNHSQVTNLSRLEYPKTLAPAPNKYQSQSFKSNPKGLSMSFRYDTTKDFAKPPDRRTRAEVGSYDVTRATLDSTSIYGDSVKHLSIQPRQRDSVNRESSGPGAFDLSKSDR